MKQEDSGGTVAIAIEAVYHLPVYKTENGLTEAAIDESLFRAFDTIARRVKLRLLLLQVETKRELPKELTLAEQTAKPERSSFASYRA